MIKLPNRHRRMGAALFLFVGLFFGVTAWFEADFALRTDGQRYAMADTIEWLVDTLRPGGAAATCVVLGALAALAFWRLTAPSD